MREQSSFNEAGDRGTALHDVQMIGPRQCWAVGDHGTLWQTEWRRAALIDTGTVASLRSVLTLTDQIGWVAGWQVRGSAELTEAVLLSTRDGGQSWQSLETGLLSPLRFVRFFGLEEGLVAGEPTRDNPTGLWTTADGGQSWQAVEGRSSRGYHSVHIASLDSGLLADRDGNISLLAGGQLLPSPVAGVTGPIRPRRGVVRHRRRLAGGRRRPVAQQQVRRRGLGTAPGRPAGRFAASQRFSRSPSKSIRCGSPVIPAA